MDKSPDAFRTISEVAGDLDLPQHVLRFWETRFNQIRPLKRGGGRRYYRPDDVDLLKGIRHLLYGEGYTIRGVQRILKEEGVRFVMDVWREGAPQPPRSGRAGDDAREETPAAEPRWGGETNATWEPDPAEEEPRFAGEGRIVDDGSEPPRGGDDRIEPTVGEGDDGPASVDPEIRAAHALAQRFAPRPAAPVAPPPAVRIAPTFSAPRPPETNDGGRAGIGQFLDRLRAGPAPSAPAVVEPSVRLPPPAIGAAAAEGGVGGLSRDDIRRLQATLFELLECKRLLDQAR